VDNCKSCNLMLMHLLLNSDEEQKGQQKNCTKCARHLNKTRLKNTSMDSLDTNRHPELYAGHALVHHYVPCKHNTAVELATQENSEGVLWLLSRPSNKISGVLLMELLRSTNPVMELLRPP
jgi:hypothetical protein